MTARRLHTGHLLLGALMLLAAVLAWRALQLARTPLPVLPAFAAPALADVGLLSRFDPFFPASAGSGENLAVTALPLSLHGLRADSATGRGSAIIATGDGQQRLFTVGEAVMDGVTLAAIAMDHVVLDRGGTREALWMQFSSDGPAGAPVVTDPAMAQRFGADAPGSGAPAPPGASGGDDQAPPSIGPDEPTNTEPARLSDAARVGADSQ